VPRKTRPEFTRGRISLSANSFEIVGLRPLAPPGGERDRERGNSTDEPPHPGPLLHKCVEEREIYEFVK
jgi:hypothetical protein